MFLNDNTNLLAESGAEVAPFQSLLFEGSAADAKGADADADAEIELTESEKMVLNAILESLSAQEESLTESESAILTESPLIRRKKVSIKKQRVTAAAMALAKAANDPLFDKLKKFLGLFRENKAAILAKYGARARSLATQPTK